MKKIINNQVHVKLNKLIDGYGSNTDLRHIFFCISMNGLFFAYIFLQKSMPIVMESNIMLLCLKFLPNHFYRLKIGEIWPVCIG